VRVHVVDPSAYTPPYDHALCHALAKADTEVELFTSHFAYGPVATPDGYERRELFYRLALGAPGGRVRLACKLAQHVPDMLRYRRAARAADIVHFQWLAVQHLDGRLLPAKRSQSGAVRPLVLTAHDVLPREPRAGQLAAQRRLYDRFDAIVVHSEHGRARLIEELGVDGERVHAIPHGAFTHLAESGPSGRRETSEVLDAGGAPSTKTTGPHAHGERHLERGPPVVLMFGLMRPYKGIDVLLDAWRGVDGEAPIADAELCIAGMPKMDIAALKAGAPANVRFDPRFITDAELPAYFERADLVVLPYLQADQSGVLFTALAFGKPLLLSDVGGFSEIARTGAARIVPAGDASALGRALRDLLGDSEARAVMAARARAAASGPYSWDRVARQTLALYHSL
jgi:glycosyltransferase involved in cell wall biosynthesis